MSRWPNLGKADWFHCAVHVHVSLSPILVSIEHKHNTSLSPSSAAGQLTPLPRAGRGSAAPIAHQHRGCGCRPARRSARDTFLCKHCSDIRSEDRGSCWGGQVETQDQGFKFNASPAPALKRVTNDHVSVTFGDEDIYWKHLKLLLKLFLLW